MVATPADREAGIDAGAVSTWIAGLGLGARPPLRFERIGNGQSNLTFLVGDADGRSWVLRRPPFGTLLASAHDVGREHRVLAALEETDAPAPRALALCEDPRVSDVPLLLMEHVDGLVVDEMPTAEALSPARRGAIGGSLITTLARIHAVDLDRTGLSTLASHAPYAARQLKRWRTQWEKVRSRDLPAVNDLAERLEAAMPAAGELTLIHGDFHLQNVIVSAADGEVRAVLDWELCTLGDPLADLGGLFAYWLEPDDPAGAVFPAPALPGFPCRRELAEEYAEATGRSLDALAFWHVLGLWKIAIIGEGVLRRAREAAGNAAPAGGENAVDDLLVRAEAIAAAAGL